MSYTVTSLASWPRRILLAARHRKQSESLSPFNGGLCALIVAPDLSYRQVLANFGLPTLKERRERLARDFFIKIVRNPDHKLCHLPHERTIKYGLQTAEPYQNPKYNIQPELRRPLFPMGLLLTGYKPQVYSYLVNSCGGAIQTSV